VTAAVAIHAFPGFEAEAEKLAAATGLPLYLVDIHTFPDGESRVTVQPGKGTAILFAGLDHPDSRLVPLILAASALRDSGADRIVLACPYLCYMRQDMAFTRGEAVSQRVIGGLLARYFDRVVTVDPHLHRISALSDVMPGIEADTLSAAALIGDIIAADPALAGAALIGPDSESRQWVSVAAERAGCAFLVAAKVRHGDRDVQVSLPHAEEAKGRPAVIVDDLISSGTTICRAAEILTEAGATRVEAIAVHVLASQPALDAMKVAGVARVRSSSSIAHPTNAFSLTPLFARALEKELHNGN
jgi:ribose-phosphate pyrophosphokinase